MCAKKFLITVILITIILCAGLSALNAQETESPSKLLILFTTDNKDVLTKMAGVYAQFAVKKEWWKETCFLIWGPSAKMIAGDKEAQEMIKKMKETGVELLACKWCADQYGVAEQLTALGVEVKYMGQGLTDMMKSGYQVLTL